MKLGIPSELGSGRRILRYILILKYSQLETGWNCCISWGVIPFSSFPVAQLPRPQHNILSWTALPKQRCCQTPWLYSVLEQKAAMSSRTGYRGFRGSIENSQTFLKSKSWVDENFNVDNSGTIILYMLGYRFGMWTAGVPGFQPTNLQPFPNLPVTSLIGTAWYSNQGEFTF